MRFFNVGGMRLLLDASAKTLEALVLDLADPRGEQLSLNDTGSSQQLRSWILPTGFRSIPKQVASETRVAGVVHRWFTRDHFFPQAPALDHHIFRVPHDLPLSWGILLPWYNIRALRLAAVVKCREGE